MTIKELSQLYYLSREIKRDTQRLEALRARASSPKSPNLNGMPKSPSFENRLEHYIAEIVDLEAVIEEKIRRCVQERDKLEKYIFGIPDSLTRQIFTLRFIDGLTWYQIAMKLGGGNTAEGVRKRAYRFLKQENGDKK